MNTYIALLRGINVGGKNILPMKELVALLEGMGYENVQTYIQSGNVVFQSKEKAGPKDATEIGRRVLEKKGFKPTVLLLSEAALQSAVENNPFPTSNGKALHFFFLETASRQPKIEKLVSMKANSEEFELCGEVFYLYSPDGVGRSKLAANVEKELGVPVTARNWNTVSKLVSMVGQSS
ncbi:MAG: DUF1697 domain-containing protein [bacterium]|nr:DUF1697 domain-containing protein [bacterium]